MYLLCDLNSPEENKAEEDSFETDLIAGRLQEEVVRVSSVLKSVIATGDIDMTPSLFIILFLPPLLYFYSLVQLQCSSSLIIKTH